MNPLQIKVPLPGEVLFTLCHSRSPSPLLDKWSQSSLHLPELQGPEKGHSGAAARGRGRLASTPPQACQGILGPGVLRLSPLPRSLAKCEVGPFLQAWSFREKGGGGMAWFPEGNWEARQRPFMLQERTEQSTHAGNSGSSACCDVARSTRLVLDPQHDKTKPVKHPASWDLSPWEMKKN